ncbi:MAG: FAD-dependent oxidoreductase [Patescibacteria group bacterium]|nr:FAD-dependent oxidoreductase [Patescibacteria group bacterium]MCL5261887.1 FAD-dependent oxidoreductase [Patescibacteria group bacterium]
MYDLIIIGGGPAGMAAGIYAGRKKLSALLISKELGGQPVLSANIQNWIGLKSISGYDLMQSIEDHLRSEKNTEILIDDPAVFIRKKGDFFEVETQSGKVFGTKTILVATGSRRRKLDVPGGAIYEGKGVAYCSTCDAPLFEGKEVAVVGGGNAGLEAVVDLLNYASKVYLLVRSDVLKGDIVTQEKIKASPKAEIIWNAEVEEVKGGDFVTGIKYHDKVSDTSKELLVSGIFVEIGLLPNSELFEGLVDMNEGKFIIINHQTGATSSRGIWAAGDVSDGLYKQNNIAVGDAVKAVLNINSYLNSLK